MTSLFYDIIVLRHHWFPASQKIRVLSVVGKDPESERFEKIKVRSLSFMFVAKLVLPVP